MFEKLKNFLKQKQKGQSLFFVAASTPIICAFVGVAMDFGWLYLNQSRLQNAADAAATAGAKSLLEDEMPLSDYSYANLIANTDSGLQEMQEKNIISNRTKNKGTTSKPEAGDSIAKYYAAYSLQDWLGSTKTKLVTTDNVGLDSSGYENVKFESTLYGQNNNDYAALYYTVKLSTKLEHLFGGILEYFGLEKLPAVATASVKITHIYETDQYDDPSNTYPHGPSLYDQMKKKEKDETYATWEDIVVAKNGSSTQANNRSVLTGGASYTSGNSYRTEVSLLNGNGFKSGKGNPASAGVDQTAYDDLFIDYQGEMNKGMSLGIDVDLDVSKTSGNWDYGNTLSNNLQYSYRIHFPVCINIAYPIRSGKKPPDSLYAFIEQEPIVRTVTRSDGSTYNRGNMSSVRQIIISANKANTNTDTDRPIVFFYEGPEIATKKENSAVYDGDDDYVGVRPFLPVILNLNANFRGIIFAPNNPVVINGNGYKLEGFVVGKSFKRLKTAADFESEGYKSTTYNGVKTYIHKDNLTKTSVPSGYVSIKALINGNWISCYVQNGQWYSRSSNPDYTQYAQINYNNDTGKYAFFDKILLPVTYNNKTYYISADTKRYSLVNSESVTYSGSVDTVNINNVFISSGSTITQKVNDMYISNTTYTYTETFVGNNSGKTKTKESTMAVGDVQFVDISTVTATKDSEGNWTETPGDAESFVEEDDSVRYDYVSIFNLSQSSTYNSFLNVGLVNYTYLAKNEFGANTSHDMFFTTKRSKHID